MILLRFQIYCFRYEKTLCTKLKAWFLFSKELASEAVEFWPEHLVTSFLAVYLLAERIRGGLPTLNTVFTRFLRLRFFLFFFMKIYFSNLLLHFEKKKIKDTLKASDNFKNKQKSEYSNVMQKYVYSESVFSSYFLHWDETQMLKKFP